MVDILIWLYIAITAGLNCWLWEVSIRQRHELRRLRNIALLRQAKLEAQQYLTRRRFDALQQPGRN